MIAKTVFILSLLFILLPALAQESNSLSYVSDRLEIPLRSGDSTRFKILQMLPSGTALTVVNTDAASGYSKVRTEDGTEGFVLSKQLIAQPNQYQAEIAALKQLLAKLSADTQQVNQAQRKTTLENQRLSQELAQLRKTAVNAINIDSRNQSLEQDRLELERSLQLAQQENQALRDTSNQAWFLRGAGVLLGGILLGVFFPRLGSRNSRRWSEL